MNANEKYQFATNINCSGCIASVKPHLDGLKEVLSWEVDTAAKEKILTVVGTNPEAVLSAVKKAGFTIERI